MSSNEENNNNYLEGLSHDEELSPTAQRVIDNLNNEQKNALALFVLSIQKQQIVETAARTEKALSQLGI